MKRFYFSLALACLLAGTLWAADDPFYGKWKLNMEKSKFAGEQTEIQDLGDNRSQAFCTHHPVNRDFATVK